jgi:hypothetical protein
MSWIWFDAAADSGGAAVVDGGLALDSSASRA